MANVHQTDFYQVLGVPHQATLKEIALAFHKQVNRLDQPMNQTSVTALKEQTEALQEAFNTLSDPKKRALYNQSLNITKSAKSALKVQSLRLATPDLFQDVERAVRKKKSQSVYQEFFGFSEKPFDLTPDPKYLYLSAKHKEVLAHLVFGLQENNGFLKIIGEVGTGKTTICRSFLRELHTDFRIAYIIHPKVNAVELLQTINAELGLLSNTNSKKILISTLNQFLLKERKLNHRVVVIIDEAQDLDPEVLEELRLLSNLETETEKLIQIVLIGQPELDQLLDQKRLRQLRQRITIQWELLPLNLDETRGYLQHRINVAQGKGKVRFSRPAVEHIYRYSDGIPRMINVVADRSLLIAYTLNTKKIGSNIIKQAANDIGGLKLSSSWKRIFGKFIFTALVLAGLLIAGLDSFVDFNTEADPKNNEDIQQIIKENPIDLSDPGDLIPQEQPAPQNSLDPANQFDDPNAVGKLQLTQPDKLVTYLSSLSLAESKIEATKWILQSWSFKKKEVAGISDLNPEEMEIRFDLLTYELNGNLKRLATLNYPALLEITLPDSMGTKYIALVSVKDSMGEFGSVDPIYMPLSAIEPLWNGKAIIHWRDFENLPENFEFGHSGKEAIWLQKNLRLLGFFRGLEAPFYGHKTDRTVRKFQRKYHIRDDGKFGAESKLMLYNLLALYPTPKLIAP